MNKPIINLSLVADPLPGAIRNWQHEDRAITFAFWVNAGLLGLALAAMPFDARRQLGLNVWIKPAKFDVSVMLYLVTVAVLLRLLGDRAGKLQRGIAFSIALSMVVENTVISLQAARGVRSHMNYTTPLNAALFGTMGVFIVVNTAAAAGLFALWCRRQPTLPPALVWGTRLGLLLFLAGSVEGVRIVANGGHTVGAPDGGPGLPLVNWSTTHGDLRVAHFFALHALQAMVLLGWGVSKVRRPVRTQIAAVATVFAGYVGGVWWLFTRAMASRPLLPR